MKWYKIVGKMTNDSGTQIGVAKLTLARPLNILEISNSTSNYRSFTGACNSINASNYLSWINGFPLDPEIDVVHFGKPSNIFRYIEQLYNYPIRVYIDNNRYLRFYTNNSTNYYYCFMEFYQNGSRIGSYRFSAPTYSNGADYAALSLPFEEGNNDEQLEIYYPTVSTRFSSKDITLQVNSWNSAGRIAFMNKTSFENFMQGISEIDLENPYSGGGVSVEGGGEGNFSEESDNPETDSIPEMGSIGTGFATIFKPSLSQLRDLSGLFWNSNVFSLLQNLVENITDMFTSLAMVPFEVEAGRQVSVTWLGIDTAVSLTLAARQYYEFDMGSIDMANDERIFTSGSVLDYSPFSKLGIYLPFIGYQELDIDECRGAVISLRYRIDILSGACVAILKVGGRDLYQFTGNCLVQIPITNESMQSLVSDAVNVGIAAAGVGATGASVGADLAEAASSKSGIEYADIANAHRSITRAESGLASASANAVIGSKPTFNKSGAISSSASMMAVKQPYLFLSTPRQSIPDHYQRYRGFPSNITSKLGDLSGFTVVEDIRLNGLVATSPEVAEIYDLLKKGVII